MIRALADRVILAEGWSRATIAVLAGAFGASAMPPFGIWPALAASLTVAVWLLDGSQGGRGMTWQATLARSALAGWLWGLGYFVAGLWWIGSAFLVEADVFAWLLPFGVLGLPALLAIFPAVGFAIARALWSPGIGRIFALAFGLSVSEWLRGHVFTGFPWNAFGLAFGQNPWLMQSASLIGMAGLTVVAVATLATPAMLGTEDGGPRRFGPVAIAAAVLALMATFGAWRLAGATDATVANVRLRIMQPNLSQDAKFRASNGPDILRNYLALSDRSTSPATAGMTGVTHLIWPESAFPFLLHREPAALAAIAGILPAGATLITGAAREGEPEAGTRRFYNSIQAIDRDGAITATYDKVHLVPFGEYVPHALDAVLRGIGIREFVKIPGGFTPGTRRSALRVAGLPPAAASVCYEAIFPEEVLPEGARPGLILNVTNDGWFGQTTGPYQHLAQARLRAVEQGLPLVRAANTGISAVVDGYGRIVASLPLGRDSVLDAQLPVALPVTVFGKAGSASLAILILVCLFAAASARWSRRGPSRIGRANDT